MDEKSIIRCCWAQNVPEVYRRYHDEEWGVPVYDDCELFEMLLLESFQAGLSWLTILKKREAFREAFDQFDVQKIASYNDIKKEELRNNKGIIRNRLKIQAAVENAKVFIHIQKVYGSFSNYIWSFTNHNVIKNEYDTIPTRTALSDAISKELKGRGMRFVGSVIVYSYLQAVGIVHDHEKTCYLYHKNF